MLTLTIPPALTGFEERHRFCDIAREKERRMHNRIGEDFAEGRITQDKWQALLDTEWHPKHVAIGNAILALRAELTDSVAALADDDPEMQSVDLDKVFSEVADTP